MNFSNDELLFISKIEKKCEKIYLQYIASICLIGLSFIFIFYSIYFKLDNGLIPAIFFFVLGINGLIMAYVYKKFNAIIKKIPNRE